MNQNPRPIDVSHAKLWRVTGYTVILIGFIICSLLLLDFIESSSISYNTNDSGYILGLVLVIGLFVIAAVQVLAVLTPIAFILDMREKLTYWRFQLLCLLVNTVVIFVLFYIVNGREFVALVLMPPPWAMSGTASCLVFINIWWVLLKLDGFFIRDS